MKTINLIYYKSGSLNGNFGDELSKFITSSLINKDKYQIVYNEKNIETNMICIGSYIHAAKENTIIYGSGIRLDIKEQHKYSNLDVRSVRGPLTEKFLIKKKNIKVPKIYGDPALLLPLFYKPVFIENLKNKIGIIAHKSNYKNFENLKLDNQFHLINPQDKWENVINKLYSCKYILSSSLHGLICSDAYNKPNLWIDKFKLEEGDFKFKDYFLSQQRKYIKIIELNEFNEELLYKDGNKVNLDKLKKAFPFL